MGRGDVVKKRLRIYRLTNGVMAWCFTSLPEYLMAEQNLVTYQRGI